MKFQRVLFLFVALCCINQVQAQKKFEDLSFYEASNGKLYKKGDKIKLNYGAGDYGNFKSIVDGKGFTDGTGSASLSLGAAYSNYIFTVKSIKRYNMKKYKGVMLWLSGIAITGSAINIEAAIEHCEIYDCQNETEEFVFDVDYKRKENFENRTEYLASNGTTYRIGDEIKLNRGSASDGDFVFLTDAKNGMVAFETSARSKGKRMGETVIIEKIKKYNIKTLQGVYFSVNVQGRAYNSILDIEGALYSCEVGDCLQKKKLESEITKLNKESPLAPAQSPNATQDKYDQLRKVSKLFDEGILTEDEFLAEKKKILDKEQ